MPDAHAGREALDHVDRILQARPGRDEHALTAAVQCLAEFRDHYVARHRNEGGERHRSTLERINAVISIVMGIHFPLGEVPWGELEKARGWLDDVVRDEATQ